ncbi:hypothetical protein [Streptomyces decoyicus]|uniref:hypothetical protein n=1 Tax=Streptomyces decoyicus TaxID=249567 RepID=UPI00364E335B
MTRCPAPSGAAEELRHLVDWLLRHKGRRTYEQVAAAATGRGIAVHPCTLRRAVDGRLPTWRTVAAYAAGTGADPDEAGRLLTAARKAAARAGASPSRPRPYSPGRITTRKGLATAMRRIRDEAGSPSLRALQNAPQAAGRLPRSTLCAVLRGQRLPTAVQLSTFLAVCRTPDRAARALLAVRDQIAGAPAPRPAPHRPRDAEVAEERRQLDEWIRMRCAGGRYDEDLCDLSSGELAALRVFTARLDHSVVTACPGAAQRRPAAPDTGRG